MKDTREVATIYYDRLQALDLDGIYLALDPGCVAQVPGATLDGRDAIRGWMKSFFDAFPGIKHDVGPLSASGDTASAELRVHGIQTQPMITPQGTIPATHRPIELQVKNTLQIRDGAITKLKIDFDGGDFMRQLGIGP